MEQTITPPKKPTLKKWQMRDLYILMSFFIIGFVVLPNSFFEKNDNFESLLAGIAFGMGAALLIRLMQQNRNVKKGVIENA